MKKSPPPGPTQTSRRYSAADKLKIVKLYLEEGCQAKQIAEQFHIGKSSVGTWVRAYRAHGSAAFTEIPLGGGAPSAEKATSATPESDVIATQILAHKEAHPTHGMLRIKQIFCRFLGLPVTVHQVRQVLDNQPKTTAPARKKPKPEPAPLCFFERHSPNELWHTDVMYFIMPNREKVFVIGYLDDYSRYVTGMELFHQQTVGNTLNLLKKACGDYTFPKEILTDGGRQFVSWTGKNQFGSYLRNHSIKHTVCRPHHPQTNGKMERFWRTLRQEFFDKAKLNSFDELCVQLQLYVKYYNFQRPHQGIGGMTPADRFFEIETEVKRQMACRISENTLELALKDNIKKPFYMVGRVGDSNVAILESKGQLSLQIDGVPHPAGAPLSFDLTANSLSVFDNQTNQENSNHGNDGNDARPERQTEPASGVDGTGEVQSDSGDLDGKGDGERNLPPTFVAAGTGGAPRSVGSGGDAAGIGAASAGAAECGSGGVVEPSGEAVGAQEASVENPVPETGIEVGEQTGGSEPESAQKSSDADGKRWRVNPDCADFSITI